MAWSYSVIPTFISLLEQANPGSLCFIEFEYEPDGPTRFKYQFIAFGALVKGYNYMRNVMVLDGTSMKGRYGGCLLTTCFQDGNFQIFSVAFGIVNNESDDAYDNLRVLTHLNSV